MSIQGDLSTLDLADLLQNLAAHRRTGTLHLAGDQGPAQLYFRDGEVALAGSPGRIPLVQVLEDSGAITRAGLEKAMKRRKRNGKLLGQVLVAQREIEEDELYDVARARLESDVCELVATQAGEFTFEEGPVPDGVFDPEERHLELALAVEPLLLEAARRADHWRLIRTALPSDGLHFIAEPSAQPGADKDLSARLLERLDGSRSVNEVVSVAPHRRFAAYTQLVRWLEERAIRPVQPEDLLALARDVAATDRKRASDIVERGLTAHPHHLPLLEERARISEELGDSIGAVEALKLLAHLHAEVGEREAARRDLEHAAALLPEDPAVWERRFVLARAEGRVEDALACGRTLAELYRAPGLHNRVVEVFERLLKIDPEDWDLVREHARSLVDCGRVPDAIESLNRHARRLLGREQYEGAKAVFEEILVHEPGNTAAQQALEGIAHEVFARRRARRRRRVRLLVAFTALCGVLAAAWYEGRARLAYAEADAEVGSRYLIEEGRYGEAVEVYQAVAAAHPLTVTALFDVRRRVGELEEKARAGTGPAFDGTFVPAPQDARALLDGE